MVPGLCSRYHNSFVRKYLSTHLHQQHITYNGRISTARFQGHAYDYPFFLSFFFFFFFVFFFPPFHFFIEVMDHCSWFS
jgi:hypothetical protein